MTQTPPQSEERETLGEDIARLVGKRISKNELVLELVSLFHRNNNVMPSHPDTLRERGIENAIEGIKDSVKFVGNPSQASGVEIDILRIRRGILALIAQEKERWESETCNWIMDNIYCQHPHACVALNKLMNHLTKRKE